MTLLSLIASSVHSINFAALGLFGATLLGATAAHVFSLLNGFDGAYKFLEKAFPGRAGAFYVRLDFAVTVLLGGALGFILFGPTTCAQAAMAGLSWVSTVRAVLRHIDNNVGDNRSSS